MLSERNTRQKELMLEYFRNNSNRHVSVQEISKNLGDKVGLTTIYRMIGNLVKKGQIVKIPLDDKQGFCYQYNLGAKKCRDHYHLICEKCGKLEHFECNNVNSVITKAKSEKDFYINSNKVVFYGRCKDCK